MQERMKASVLDWYRIAGDCKYKNILAPAYPQFSFIFLCGTLAERSPDVCMKVVSWLQHRPTIAQASFIPCIQCEEILVGVVEVLIIIYVQGKLDLVLCEITKDAHQHSIHHVFCCCSSYTHERESSRENLSVRIRELTIADVLASWQSPWAAKHATAALRQYLRNTELFTIWAVVMFVVGDVIACSVKENMTFMR